MPRKAASQRLFGGQHVRNHLEPAIVGIGVAPVPLVACHLDHQIALGDLLLLEQHGQGEGADDHEDQDRHDRPRHLDRGVVGKACRRRVSPAVEADEGIDHQADDERADGGDDDQQHSVEPLQVARQFGGGRLEAGAALVRPTDDLKVLCDGRSGQ